ncbi:MAG: enoyl-CoA hydratase/isomerase family protein [Acidobacteria bacterium]|nr:enoyl-CoA hydratase/isomerase family protein [Acidobacteriota bacterium]
MENILFEINQGIATVTLNRPKALNALNQALLAELSLCLDRIENEAEIAAAILTGAGEKAFVAGADIKELAALDATSGQALAERGQALFRRIENLGKPVIAAVNGFALGGGCELALACTFRVCSTNAFFGLPEVSLGLIPGYGGTQRLSRLVGKGLAMEWILTGDKVSAQRAYESGLVNHVFEPAELLPKTIELVQKIMARGPLAVRQAMRAVHMGLDMSLDQGQSMEATLFGLCCGSEDAKEGLSAFIEKRPTAFKGC